VAEGADIAMAVTTEEGRPQRQPVFCLLRSTLLEDLEQALQAGERKIDRWTARHRMVEVPFDDADAFFNANTPEELQALSRQR
jgi:molybdenum cofactor guanylyltransferase